MVKKLKWIKKQIKRYSFLILMAAVGIFYLTAVDSWEVYANPISQIRQWHEKRQPEAGSVSAGDNQSAEGEAGEGSSETGQAGQEGSETGRKPSEGAGQQGGEISLPGMEASAPGEEASLPGTGSASSNTSQGPAPSVNPQEIPYRTVEDDYFSDAVFIGDSRTVGLFEYGGLENISTFYASTGLTVYKLFDAPIVTVEGKRQKQTIEQALSEHSFAKIYLMIGINEMGTGTVESFMEKYKEVVEHLKELQPEAIIYLQAIMKVTTERSNQGDYIHNEGIEARNQEIAKLADGVQTFYLDVNPLICDDTGGMEPSYTFDGVHLKAQYISIWKDFLKSHGL